MQKKLPLSIELVPLGTDAANKTPYQKLSAYLINIQIDGLNTSENNIKRKKTMQILLDCGNSRILKSEFVKFDDLKCIFFSHSHFDHSRYIGKLIKKIKKSKRKEPLFIICHHKAWKWLKKLIFINNFHIPRFIKYIPSQIILYNLDLKKRNKKSKTDFSQIEQLQDIILEESILIETKIACAMHSRNSIAFRFNISEYTKKKDDLNPYLDLVYSPDTSFKSIHLIEFAKNAQYWMLDCTFTREFVEDRYSKYIEDKPKGEITRHSSPYHSGILCDQAQVENFILIHYFWKRFAKNFEDVEQNLIKRAKTSFNGNIIVAKDLIPIHFELKTKKHNHI